MFKLLAVLIAVISIFAVGFVSACGEGTKAATVTDDGMVISLDDITTSPKFFGATIDGTYMEVIAIKSGTNYRVALNTCNSCKGSSKAYYTVADNKIKCNNCGISYALSTIGSSSTDDDGCGPIPVPSSYRTKTDTDITIHKNFLVSYKSYFKNWKK